MVENGVCCFTGHRDFERTASPTEILIFEKLINNLIGFGYTTFIAGGALGFDTFAAENILKRREQGSAVRLELVLPCANQAERWKPFEQQRYQNILRAADRVECLYERYNDTCMHERNRRMVDRSSICVAYCKHSAGGTASTVRYAASHGLTVYNIAEMASKL